MTGPHQRWRTLLQQDEFSDVAVSQRDHLLWSLALGEYLVISVSVRRHGRRCDWKVRAEAHHNMNLYASFSHGGIPGGPEHSRGGSTLSFACDAEGAA